MRNWISDNIASLLMFLFGGAISAVIWVTSTFATAEVVKTNKAEMIEYIDKGADSIEKRLDKIDAKLDIIVRNLPRR